MSDNLKVSEHISTDEALDIITPMTQVRGPMGNEFSGIVGVGNGLYDYYLANALFSALRNAAWLEQSGKKAPKPSQIIDDAIEQLAIWDCI